MGTVSRELRATPAACPLLIVRAMLTNARYAAAAVLALAFASAPSAGASPTNRLSDLAAGATRLFALRANTVVTFDASGREIARCSRFDAPPPPATAPPPARGVDAEEALRLAGLPDDDTETAEAEDLLDDEGLTPRRRRRGIAADAPIVAHALAASTAGDDVWIATSDGLYRGSSGRCTRVALAHRDTVVVAVAGDAVAAATDELLWRSHDGGPFRIAAGVAARPRALAMLDDQHTLVATDDAVLEIGPYGITRTVLDHGADALAVCGGSAVALASDGTWTWTGDDTPQRVGDRPPARTLTCGDGRAARFVAGGDAVFVSADGSTWRERTAPPGRAVNAVATLAGRIWVTAGDDLIPLGGAPSPASVAPALAPPSPTAPMPALAPLPTRRLTGATFPWPQLTLVFAGQRTPLREGWSLVVLVGFHLGRSPISAADRRHLAAELLRRDAELAAEERELAAPGAGDNSRGARLRAVRQEREALR
jgi:hypothetical protein